MSVVRVPAQPVDATQALNLCAGVSGAKQTSRRKAATSVDDPTPKIGEHKVVRYLVGPPDGKIEDTRWWTFAFWAHRQAFSRKRL
jgi:hypothetical protein